ncbi:MAG: hypothetical protein ABSD74_00175 [Rhizomicrobium sp.]|jgi:hypothetical protein
MKPSATSHSKHGPAAGEPNYLSTIIPVAADLQVQDHLPNIKRSIWGKGCLSPVERVACEMAFEMLEPVAGETICIVGCGLCGPLVEFAKGNRIRADCYETGSLIECVPPAAHSNITFRPFEQLSRSQRLYDMFVIADVGRFPYSLRELFAQIHRVMADGARLLAVDTVGIDAGPGEASALMGRAVHDSFPFANALSEVGFVVADRRDLSRDVAALVRDSLAGSVGVFEAVNKATGKQRARIADELVNELEKWATVHRAINSGALGVGAFLARKPSRAR